MEEKNPKYKEDLYIDRYSLDKEWEEQPVKFLGWYEKEIEAQFQRDKTKEQLDLIRAELDGEIRQLAAESSTKITEAVVASEILKHSRYKEASSNYLESVKNAKTLSAARESFEHRKKALEKLTDLFIAGYWASPYIKNNTRKEIEKENSEQARQTLQRAMRNRKSEV